jgi:hypothetical protein
LETSNVHGAYLLGIWKSGDLRVPKGLEKIEVAFAKGTEKVMV